VVEKVKVVGWHVEQVEVAGALIKET